MGTAALALLHALVLAYWVGGDLGAFYSSYLLGDARLPLERRLAAAKVLAAVDMAPRSAMILALPTGLTLATARGWIAITPLALAALWVGSALWLGVIWALHVQGDGGGGPLKQADFVIRWSVLTAVLVAALGVLTGRMPAPQFLGLKLLLLSAAMATGLAIRAATRDLRPALAEIAREGESAAADATVSRALRRARPLVILIWLIVLAAAFVGFWKPVWS